MLGFKLNHTSKMCFKKCYDTSGNLAGKCRHVIGLGSKEPLWELALANQKKLKSCLILKVAVAANSSRTVGTKTCHSRVCVIYSNAVDYVMKHIIQYPDARTTFNLIIAKNWMLYILFLISHCQLTYTKIRNQHSCYLIVALNPFAIEIALNYLYTTGSAVYLNHILNHMWRF